MFILYQLHAWRYPRCWRVRGRWMDVEFTFLADLSGCVFYHLSSQDHRQGNRSLLNYMLCCWRQYTTEVKYAALESERSWFKSQLFHFLTVWPSVGPLTSLSRNRASLMRWFRWLDELKYVGRQHIIGGCHGCQHPFQFLQGWGCFPLTPPSFLQQWPTHNGCSMNACWLNTKNYWTETSRCINQPASQVSNSDLPK